MYKLLVADDERFVRKGIVCETDWKSLGFGEILEASNGREALEMIRSEKPDLIISDIRMPKMSGIEMLKAMREEKNDTPVIFLTAYSEFEYAREALKLYAFDYILKPFDIDEIDRIASRCIGQMQDRESLEFLKGKTQEFIGVSDAAMRIRRHIGLLGKNSTVNVLIRGETGTGKEVAASLIHACSDRMVRINCSAIPEHLMESELFGYERGAFAGAMKTKKGLIELAAGGTVFLDEIGELPLSMQTKILTFLDHKKFKRVGGLEDIEVDARVIAATNRNLEHAVKQGEFREDLFYRINVMELVIPPLRDRREDIPALCDYYLKYYNGMFGKNITHVDPDFMRELLLYDWKGNVRELKNIFERCFLFCQGDVLEKHVELKRVDWKDDTRTGEPFALKDLRKGPISLDQEVSMLEQIYMDQALKLCGNNVTKAAALLGITRFSMKRRLDKED